MRAIIQQIVSGGQTGVDRAALRIARYREIPHGGWCPRGRRAEDGPIPDFYQLRETDSPDYPARTEQNVLDSDGTLILFLNKLSGGTKLTKRFAIQHSRPCHCVDLGAFSRRGFRGRQPDKVLTDFDHDNETVLRQSVTTCLEWVASENIQKLNIAGPRESSCPGIFEMASNFLLILLPPETLG